MPFIRKKSSSRSSNDSNNNNNGASPSSSTNNKMPLFKKIQSKVGPRKRNSSSSSNNNKLISDSETSKSISDGSTKQQPTSLVDYADHIVTPPATPTSPSKKKKGLLNSFVRFNGSTAKDEPDEDLGGDSLLHSEMEEFAKLWIKPGGVLFVPEVSVYFRKYQPTLSKQWTDLQIEQQFAKWIKTQPGNLSLEANQCVAGIQMNREQTQTSPRKTCIKSATSTTRSTSSRNTTSSKGNNNALAKTTTIAASQQQPPSVLLFMYPVVLVLYIVYLNW